MKDGGPKEEAENRPEGADNGPGVDSLPIVRRTNRCWLSSAIRKTELYTEQRARDVGGARGILLFPVLCFDVRGGGPNRRAFGKTSECGLLR